MTAPATRDWPAWEDRQPITPPEGATLHVSGEVETTNGSIVPVLRPSVPQGFNTSILMLDLALENTGPGTTDINYRPAKYEKNVSQGMYSKVQILWQGEIIETLDVEIVQ